jgi:hypothetical protein
VGKWDGQALRIDVSIKIFFFASTKLLASTTLRNILGTKNLSEILSDREHIARDILAHLDTATDAWGIKVCIIGIGHQGILGLSNG